MGAVVIPALELRLPFQVLHLARNLTLIDQGVATALTSQTGHDFPTPLLTG